MELKQVTTIEVGRNGGESLYFHDVDDDGQKELIFRQIAGLLAQEEYRKSEGLDQENFDLLCYTCFRQDSTMLWQYGSPWTQRRPYRNHGEIALTAIVDINNDGKTELLYKYRDRLVLRDISNGELIKEVRLPNDDGWKIALQNAGGESPNIIVLGEHQMLAYSSDFVPLWEKKGDEEFSALPAWVVPLCLIVMVESYGSIPVTGIVNLYSEMMVSQICSCTGQVLVECQRNYRRNICKRL